MLAFFPAVMVLTQGCGLQVFCPFSFGLDLASFMWWLTSYTHLKIDHLYGSDPVRYYPVISKPSWFLSLHCDVCTTRLPNNVFLGHYLRMFPQPIHVYALELGRRAFSSILVPFEKWSYYQHKGHIESPSVVWAAPFLNRWCRWQCCGCHCG